jgi:CNT family concentrative nucleoside transporter
MHGGRGRFPLHWAGICVNYAPFGGAMTPVFRRYVLWGVLSAFLVLFGLWPATAQDGPKPPPPSKTAAAKTDTKTDAPGKTDAPAKTAAPKPQKKIDFDDLKKKGAAGGSSTWDRLRSILGMLFLLGICVAMSNNRKKISWRLVAWGLGLQLILGVIVMKTALGHGIFSVVNDLFTALMACSTEGSKFLFGNLAVANNIPVGNPVYGPMAPVVSSGQAANVGAYFAFNVLPTIIFFSSLMAVLYHMGFMQWVVKGVAQVMQKTMGTSGSETLSASGNIFVGQTEAPLLVRPFVSGMTQSELMAVMTGGFATVAGGVMAAYVGMLSGLFEGVAGHLLSASVMSAPAALVVAKLIVPEPVPEKSETYGELKVELEKVDANVIDAAARGAGDGLKLALNVGAMLMAFIALIFMFNSLLGWGANKAADAMYGKTWKARVTKVSKDLTDAGREEDADAKAKARAEIQERVAKLAREGIGAAETLKIDVLLDKPAEGATSKREGDLLTVWIGDLGAKAPGIKGVKPLVKSASVHRGMAKDSTREVTFRSLRLEMILGWLLAPLAWIMGVPWGDAFAVGQLIGVKTVVNEFVAYLNLGGMIRGGAIQDPRSMVIATYALCGFANFGSIAIQIGGIGGIAPDRRQDLAKLGMRAMIGGTIAALLTATVAGLLV